MKKQIIYIGLLLLLGINKTYIFAMESDEKLFQDRDTETRNNHFDKLPPELKDHILRLEVMPKAKANETNNPLKGIGRFLYYFLSINKQCNNLANLLMAQVLGIRHDFQNLSRNDRKEMLKNLYVRFISFEDEDMKEEIQQKMRELVLMGVDVNQCYYFDDENGKSKNMKLDAEEGYGYPIIILFTRDGLDKVAELLILRRANVNATPVLYSADKEIKELPNTAIICAINNGLTELVKLLLERKACLDIYSGFDPMHLAITKGFFQISFLLDEYEKELNASKGMDNDTTNKNIKASQQKNSKKRKNKKSAKKEKCLVP